MRTAAASGCASTSPPPALHLTGRLATHVARHRGAARRGARPTDAGSHRSACAGNRELSLTTGLADESLRSAGTRLQPGRAGGRVATAFQGGQGWLQESSPAGGRGWVQDADTKAAAQPQVAYALPPERLWRVPRSSPGLQWWVQTPARKVGVGGSETSARRRRRGYGRLCVASREVRVVRDASPRGVQG